MLGDELFAGQGAVDRDRGGVHGRPSRCHHGLGHGCIFERPARGAERGVEGGRRGGRERGGGRGNGEAGGSGGAGGNGEAGGRPRLAAHRSTAHRSAAHRRATRIATNGNANRTHSTSKPPVRRPPPTALPARRHAKDPRTNSRTASGPPPRVWRPRRLRIRDQPATQAREGHPSNAAMPRSRGDEIPTVELIDRLEARTIKDGQSRRSPSGRRNAVGRAPPRPAAACKANPAPPGSL